MAVPAPEECGRMIFAPLVGLAERPDLAATLRTADIADQRKAEQFARYKNLRFNNENVLYLPNSGFCCSFRENDNVFFSVSASSFSEKDEDQIQEWLSRHRYEVLELDESIFLRMAYHLSGYMRVADEYRTRARALDVIDIVDDEYAGHDIFQLIDIYRPVKIFHIPADAPEIDKTISFIASSFVYHVDSFRSHLIEGRFNEAVSNLITLQGIAPENIFQAQTSSQWRHVFLELYRVLEALFYLPWVLAFKHMSSSKIPAYQLKDRLRAALRWREKEKDSIVAIFETLNMSKEINELEDSVEIFSELKKGAYFNRGQIGKRIYDIRNSLVHFEEYDGNAKLPSTDKDWEKVCLYLALSLERIYQHNATEVAIE